jgi:hypothetical protein
MEKILHRISYQPKEAKIGRTGRWEFFFLVSVYAGVLILAAFSRLNIIFVLLPLWMITLLLYSRWAHGRLRQVVFIIHEDGLTVPPERWKSDGDTQSRFIPFGLIERIVLKPSRHPYHYFLDYDYLIMIVLRSEFHHPYPIDTASSFYGDSPMAIRIRNLLHPMFDDEAALQVNPEAWKEFNRLSHILRDRCSKYGITFVQHYVTIEGGNERECSRCGTIIDEEAVRCLKCGEA